MFKPINGLHLANNQFLYYGVDFTYFFIKLNQSYLRTPALSRHCDGMVGQN